MKQKISFRIRYLPLVLSLLFISFISLFALDVLSAGYPLPQLIIALLIHLVPSILLAILTLIAWKKPRAGGFAFIILALLFTIHFNTYRHPTSLLLISTPPLLIGILFLTLARSTPHH